MPWTRLDDGFHTNPKVIGLTDSAYRLFVNGLNWSVANMTDGRISPAAVAVCLPSKTARSRVKTIEELVAVGLWNRSDSGWEIHDFDEYQETKKQVQERRGKWAEQKRNQRDTRETRPLSLVESTADRPPEPRPVSTADSVETPRAGADTRALPPHPNPENTSLSDQTTNAVSHENGSRRLPAGLSAEILTKSRAFRVLQKRRRWPEYEAALVDWTDDLDADALAAGIDVFVRLANRGGYADTPQLLRTALEKVSIKGLDSPEVLAAEPDWAREFKV